MKISFFLIFHPLDSILIGFESAAFVFLFSKNFEI
jgi:hypothetical protein